MPLTINGQTYYRTAEACRIIGISRSTFLRWAREGHCPDVQCRDRRGWRLFSGDEVEKIKAEANQLILANAKGGNF